MATARKKFNPKGKVKTDIDTYNAFMADLLSGAVVAIKLVEGRKGNGALDLDYDDPNG
jgi:hypothetical protein